MPRVVQFTHEGRSYRAEVHPVPDGAAEFRDGAWFVSVDGGLPHRVFEVQPGDVDSPALRHRLMIASWLLEGWKDRRTGADRRKAGSRPGAVERRLTL